MANTTKKLKTRGSTPLSLSDMTAALSLQTLMADAKAVLIAWRRLDNPDGEGGSTRVENLNEVATNLSYFLYMVL